jgi:rhodanese-related sulfurtransferase
MADTPAPRRIPVGEAHSLAEQGQAVLLDARDERLFDNAHIKGAVSLPLARVAPGALPGHPGLLIFYCA